MAGERGFALVNVEGMAQRLAREQPVERRVERLFAAGAARLLWSVRIDPILQVESLAGPVARDPCGDINFN